MIGFLLSCLRGFGAEPALPPQVGKPIYTFDARPFNRVDLHSPADAAKLWDTLHLLAAMQGLANRQSARFYIFYCNGFGVDTDTFWFDWLRGEDGWLAGREVRTLLTVSEVVETLGDAFKGLVVYDPAVPATSDLASTAAGCEDLLPVRLDRTPGSVFDLLVTQMKLPVKLWLVEPDGKSRFTGQGNIPDGERAVQRERKSGLLSLGAEALRALWIMRPGHRRLLRRFILAAACRQVRSHDAHALQSRLFYCQARLLL